MKYITLILAQILSSSINYCFGQIQCDNPKLPASSAASAAGSGGNFAPPDCNLDNGDQSNGGDDNNWAFIIYGIGSWDPNLIVTSPGIGKPKWVSVNDKIGATIYFENDPNLATAPVHNAYIYYAFPAKQDAVSFRLGNFGFNGWVFTVPQNLNSYQARLDLRDSLGLYVDITAGIDVVTNRAFWIFQSIDPQTNLPPADPMKGFLPIKDTSQKALSDSILPKGEGFVSFTAASYKTAKTRDTMYAQAKIVFDINDTIPTNIDFNTIDAVAPTSKIHTSTVSGNTISLFWSGNDDAGGSGVKDYSMYVSENDSPFVFYKTVTGLTTDYTGNPGNKYCFYVMARDSVNNLEAPLKNLCEVTDSLTGGPPLPVTWLYFRGAAQVWNVLLSWTTGSETNTSHFVVERSLNGRDFTEIGKVTAGHTGSHHYTYLDVNALKLAGITIYYRLRQVDLDGRYVYSSILNFSTRTDEYVKVYPNPFSQILTVVINTAEPVTANDHLELYAMNGALLYQRTLSDRQNNVPVVLDNLPALARGTYFLRMNLNGKMSTVKIVKQ